MFCVVVEVLAKRAAEIILSRRLIYDFAQLPRFIVPDRIEPADVSLSDFTHGLLVDFDGVEMIRCCPFRF